MSKRNKVLMVGLLVLVLVMCFACVDTGPSYDKNGRDTREGRTIKKDACPSDCTCSTNAVTTIISKCPAKPGSELAEKRGE